MTRQNYYAQRQERRQRERVRTTNSRHSLPVFTNLAKGLDLTGPNQLWVADITYIRSAEGYLYLSLITDGYSRKIVGSHLDNTLETEGCLRALDMALKSLPAGSHPVHHSDRGCQYASHLYVNRLRAHGLPVSMTEENHCYENAKAERVNGILKGEYEMDRVFASKSHARERRDRGEPNPCRERGNLPPAPSAGQANLNGSKGS
jgi:putative transposase